MSVTELVPLSDEVLSVGQVAWLESLDGELCFVDALASDGGSLSERFGPEVSCAHGGEVRGEFGFGADQFVSGLFDGGVVRCGFRGDGLEFVEDDLVDVGVNNGREDAGGGGTHPGAVLPRTDVVGVGLAVVLDGASCHDVTAALATDQAREHRSLLVSVRRSGATRLALSGVPYLLGNERRVSGGVGVLPDGQLPEIHAVLEEVAGALVTHPEVRGDLNDGVAVCGPLERGLDALGVLVGGELAGVGVAAVPERGLASLPDAAFGCGRSEVLEPFAVKVKFVFGDGGEHGAGEASRGRGGVDVLADGDDLAPGGFDAVPQLKEVADAARCSAEVRDDQAAVLTGFDGFDGFGEDGAGVVAAAGVQLGGEHHDRLAAGFGPRLDAGFLVFGASEAVAAALADVRDADVAAPRPFAGHAGECTKERQLVAPRDVFPQYKGETQ